MRALYLLAQVVRIGMIMCVACVCVCSVNMCVRRFEYMMCVRMCVFDGVPRARSVFVHARISFYCRMWIIRCVCAFVVVVLCLSYVWGSHTQLAQFIAQTLCVWRRARVRVRVCVCVLQLSMDNIRTRGCCHPPALTHKKQPTFESNTVQLQMAEAAAAAVERLSASARMCARAAMCSTTCAWAVCCCCSCWWSCCCCCCWARFVLRSARFW